MINSDELKILDQGSGYTVGELTETHPHLDYLREGALVTLFDGLDKTLDYVAEKMPVAKESKSSESTGRDRFNSFATYTEALDTFRNNPQSVVKFDPTEMSIKDIQEAGSILDYDVTGDFIDMGRYMEGLPESWGSLHNGNARNRRVNLIINLNQMCSMDERAINHRSERILRLVDALEAGGVRTELKAIESTQCGHFEFLLKHHDEPLTIPDLAVAGHSEFLRRVIFRLCEYSKTWDYGYGNSVRFSRAMTPESIESDNTNELNILVDNNMEHSIDSLFDSLERLLVWEMSKPVPEMSSVKIDSSGVWFNPNGARDEDSIRSEGQAILNG